MSVDWIDKRLIKSVGPLKAGEIRKVGYSRQVLFFSIPQAVAHAEALIMLTAQKTVPPSFHGGHQLTREWGDNEIAQVVNDRAGLIGSANRRNR